MKLVFKGETIGDIMHQMSQAIAAFNGLMGELAKHNLDENIQTDSPDAFTPDFKDDMAPVDLDDDISDIGTDKPKKTRKRQLKKKAAAKKAKAEPVEDAPAEPETPVEKPKKGSRRRGNGAANPAAQAVTSVGVNTGSEISDRDVSKAASNAASVLTPIVVKGVKSEYGVTSVGELDQDQRREFIDRLNVLLEEANTSPSQNAAGETN